MSVSFFPATYRATAGGTTVIVAPLLRCADSTPEDGDMCTPTDPCAACHATFNLNSRNAHDLLVHIGLDAPVVNLNLLVGDYCANALADLCRKRLAMDVTDEELPARRISARAVELGRPAGRLNEYTRKLLRVALLARGNRVAWS